MMKYTGRMPSRTKSAEDSRSTTPSFSRFNSFRQRGMGGRSPLGSPSAFLQQQGGIEALFQKGAKGVMERSEKLGISQAVRDAMGEIRRNVQGLNESRPMPRSLNSGVGADEATATLKAMERRNKQLASMLDETVSNLRALSASKMEDTAKSLELIEIAAAKVQFVQIYLEDASMDMPPLNPPEPQIALTDAQQEEPSPGQEAETDSAHSTTLASPVDVSSLSIEDDALPAQPQITPNPPKDPDAMEIGDDERVEELPPVPIKAKRPDPIPTRSTLAQSSFSWMLEPDETQPTTTTQPGSKSPPSTHSKKKSIGNASASRERNAFLFGEIVPEPHGGPLRRPDDIFGMQPLRKAKDKS
jgi:TBC1 domain family member 5